MRHTYRIRRRHLWLALVAIALVATACGSDEPSVTTGSPVTSPSTSVATTSSTAPPDATTATEASTTTTAAETTTTSDGVVRFEISVEGGDVTGGGRLEVPLGSDVEITVSSDVGDEVHLHGYDVLADVEAGSSVQLSFTADIPGVFELELEDARLALAELEISP